jgi:hypothetical protein
VGLSYLDAEYRNTDNVISTYAGPVSLQGKSPINTPSWNFNGFVGYTRPLPSQWQLTVSSDFSWTDERYLEATNQPFDQADAFWLVNARAALLSPDPITTLLRAGRSPAFPVHEPGPPCFVPPHLAAHKTVSGRG